MKQKGAIIVVILLAVVILLSAFGYKKLSESYKPSEVATATDKPSELKPAPDFEVWDVKGNPVKLSDFKGKPVVVNFWATWCPPCKSELPYFEELYMEYGEDVEFLMVNITDGQKETIETVNTFLEETGYTFPVYYDKELNASIAYATYSVPVTVFVDSDGNLVGKQVGAMRKEILEAYLLRILG